jgi:hypothetical protein
MIKLTHDFGWQHRPAVLDLLEGTTRLDQYLRKLRAYARENRSPDTPDDAQDPTQLKIIGDGFEYFGEAFLRLCGRLDNRIFIRDFERLAITDNGVDGVGYDSMTGQVVFIQFKCYRETEFLNGTESHLDSFVAETAMLLEDQHKYPRELTSWPRRVVITSAADIHPYTKEKKYRGRVECFPHTVLKRLVDNGSFWDDFRELANA